MVKTKHTDPTEWFPMPIVLISYFIQNNSPNIMVAGYAGFCCWSPPIICLGINCERYTRENISVGSELIVNLPAKEQVYSADYCGYISGVNHDKFKSTGLTYSTAVHVNAPLINECPVNIECQIKQIIPQGSHDLILAKVLVSHVDEDKAHSSVILYHREYICAETKLGELGLSQGRVLNN